ncbi:MAG: amino acid adenylation domain-containing protein, partial [Planctomycetes bacterium]|nr:amino acid adenylation domain-containing protein [Planctomycetota bacterium]
DAVVAVLMERSIEMVIGIFAILKSGTAYLPVAPNYPVERIRYILSDSGARLVLSTRNSFGQGDPLESENQLSIVINQRRPASPPSRPLWRGLSRLSYVIYTSGSTGRPKGVPVDHRAVVNLLFALQEKYPVGSTDVYLFKTSYVFDVSVTELFGWFMGKGKLVVLEKGGEKDVIKLADVIEDFGVTHINFVP